MCLCVDFGGIWKINKINAKKNNSQSAPHTILWTRLFDQKNIVIIGKNKRRKNCFFFSFHYLLQHQPVLRSNGILNMYLCSVHSVPLSLLPLCFRFRLCNKPILMHRIDVHLWLRIFLCRGRKYYCENGGNCSWGTLETRYNRGKVYFVLYACKGMLRCFLSNGFSRDTNIHMHPVFCTFMRRIHHFKCLVVERNSMHFLHTHIAK